MFSLFNKSLVILLTLLQLVSPLVHAHAGSVAAHAGLHIPGLEAYSILNETLSHETAISPQSSDCTIVAVDTGIKPAVCRQTSDNGQTIALPFQFYRLNLTVSLFYNNFSPPELLPARQVFSSQASPRAPPAV